MANNLEQQQSQEIISSQEIGELLTQLNTPQNKDLKDFADNFSKKNPDKNSELIASLSVLSEIKDPKQFKLATLILEKTNINPSILASESKYKVDFLPYYTNLLQSKNLIDKKLDLMQKPN